LPIAVICGWLEIWKVEMAEGRLEKDFPGRPGRRSVLIADPVLALDAEIAQRLVREGFDVMVARRVSDAASQMAAAEISYCMTELRFSDGTGFDILRMIAGHHPSCRTIVHSGHCDIATAVAVARAGAADVLPKPMTTDFLLAVLLDRDLRHSGCMETLQGPNVVREEHIRQVLISCGANVSRTAHRLSMHRRTLQRMLEKSPSLRALVR